eukprot:4214819-Ditylum_brightwellii.AAC.1
MLKELGHQQPATLIQAHNSTAYGINMESQTRNPGQNKEPSNITGCNKKGIRNQESGTSKFR